MDYPKPAFNTRIAGHLTANQYAPVGFDERSWLNECKQMGWSWVKGLSDRDGDTGIKWAPIALEMGLMPVVRIYQPMPWNLDDTIKRAIDRLVAVGVRYIETLNEPDNVAEWDVPDDWAEQAAAQQITVARYIQQAGGIPLIAALSTGSPDSYTDMTAMIVQAGGGDVLEEDKEFVMSIHNYTLNHPLGLKAWGQSDTYPLDDVNQEGAPISEKMYLKYGEQNSLAWEGRSREWVNQRRMERKNPGATIFTDNCGEVNLFYVAEKARETLGFYPMCIVTEGGVVIGDAQDDRYPKNTGEYMRDANVEIGRRCMGVSVQDEGRQNYPDYVLAGGGYWLLGNYRLGHTASNWESQAWYTDTWPQYNSGGRLWVVDSMKAMPKVAYGTSYEPPIEPPDEPNNGTTEPTEGAWVIKSQRRVPGSEWGFRHAQVYGHLSQGEDPWLLGEEVTCWWDGMDEDQKPFETYADEDGYYEFTLSVGQFHVQVEDGEIAHMNTHLKPEEEEPGMTTGHVGFEVDFEWKEAEEPMPEPPISEWEDISDKLMTHPEKEYAVRDKSMIDEIIFHHVGVEGATVENTAKYCVETRGWPGIGYHFWIMPNGTIFQTNPLENISYR